jgi:hypothetical protein
LNLSHWNTVTLSAPNRDRRMRAHTHTHTHTHTCTAIANELKFFRLKEKQVLVAVQKCAVSVLQRKSTGSFPHNHNRTLRNLVYRPVFCRLRYLVLLVKVTSFESHAVLAHFKLDTAKLSEVSWYKVRIYG